MLLLKLRRRVLLLRRDLFSLWAIMKVVSHVTGSSMIGMDSPGRARML